MPLYKSLAGDDAVGKLCLEDRAGGDVRSKADYVAFDVGGEGIAHVEYTLGAGHL